MITICKIQVNKIFYDIEKDYGSKINNNEGIRAESFMAHYWGSTIEQKINLYKQKVKL